MDILENEQEQINIKSSLTQELMQHPGGQISELGKFIKSSGVYALSSVATPLISLVLAPFLTHSLSTSDYGVLTLLSTIIGLTAGITQLGMGSAFFRAYNYDYTERNERHSVVATAIFLLFIVSLLTAIGAIILAPFLAYHLLGNALFSRLIIIAGGIVFLQNLAVPSFAWLRAENRAFFYSLLSIGNILITLLANIVLVGILRRGIEGALIATGTGYIGVVFCTFSIIIFRVGIKIRLDIARNLLGFGLPLIFSFVSYWVLQLSDRYLLSRLSSLEETAKYAIAYTLGTAISVVVIGPFTLAWPTTMFTIARSKDATRVFQMAFRWLSLFLLLTALILSFCALLMLNWFFPLAYHSVALVIPIVSASMVFYGIYYIFMIGANIKRKTWTSSIFTTLAAIVNLLINLVLIPRYGATGAAVSTLVAYILLALSAYVVNQKLYPIAFEIERFVLALLPGVALYSGASILVQKQGIYATLGIYTGTIILYACILTAFAVFPSRNSLFRRKNSVMAGAACTQRLSHTEGSISKDTAAQPVPTKVCMHIRGVARTDARVLREATALIQAGFVVTIIDVESERARPVVENIAGIRIQHIFPPLSFIRTKFKVRMLIRSVYQLITARADAYHAHDASALPGCYLAALLMKKPLIFDAHELPVPYMAMHWKRFCWVFKGLLEHILPRCAGVITVSSYIGQELHRRYHAPEVVIVRNFPPYQMVARSNHLRQRLGLRPETHIVLYQGNIQADRSLEKLVYAAPFLPPDTAIVMMGWASDEVRKQLDNLIKQEKVEDRVKILPAVPYEDLLDWTSSADIGLVLFAPDYSLSIRWCLPNKLFEYLMAGLPVLASPLDAVAEVLKQYDVGLVVSSLAPADIGTAIKTMLTDSTTLERMRSNALAAAQKELCWEQERYQLIQLYRSIMSI